MVKKSINHHTEANNVDKVLSNHLGKIGLTPDQYDMNFTIFNELTNSNVRPDCCVKIATKYGIIFENKVDYKDLASAKIQGLKYLELLKKNNALCDRSVLIVTDGLSFDVGQYEIHDDAIVFVKSLQIDTFDQITMEWMTQYAGTIVKEEKKAITSGDKAELKKTFDKINNYLRDKGLGKDSRLHITSAMLFLKLIKENDDLFQIMDKTRVNKIEQSLKNVRADANELSILTCFKQLADAYEGDFNFNLADYESKNIIEGLFAIVDELHLANYDLDIKGEAFEYFINYGNTSSDMGEYFTPRHIVNFMIRLLDKAFEARRERRFGKTYLDPTCGTGGFLIKIFQQVQAELKERNELTDDNKQKLKTQTVYGNELNLRSSEIAKMNMILTGDGHSNIGQGDFLVEKDNRKNRYDVTIGNPPFGGKKEKSEVHFVDGFLDDVKEGGYSLIVIPEGILFNSNNEFVKLRKRLLMQGRILSIISLPKGVFLPYAGVKTDIIFWKKEQGISDYDIEMVDIRNDGFSLDSHRRPLASSDLDLYFSDKQKLIDNGQIYMVNTNTIYDVHELARLESEQVTLSAHIASDTTLIKTIKKQISQITDTSAKDAKLGRIEQLTIDLKVNETKLKKIKDKIKGFDINLVVSRYRPRKEKGFAVEWVKLSDIFDEIKIGGTPSRQKDEYFDGDIVWVSISDMLDQSIIYDSKEKITEEGLKNSNCKIIKKESLLFSFKLTIGRTCFAGVDLCTNEAIAAFEITEKNKEVIDIKYLNYILSYHQRNSSNSNTNVYDAILLNKQIISNFEIPLPSLEEQQRIVDSIERIESVKKSLNEAINDYIPSYLLDDHINYVDLGSICDVVKEKIEAKGLQEGSVYYLGLEDIESNTGIITKVLDSHLKDIESTKNIFQEGDVLYGKLRPYLNKVGYAEKAGICSTDILPIRFNEKIAFGKFYWYLLRESKYNVIIDSGSKGAQLPRVDFEFMKTIQVPLPPLEIQQQIVVQLDEEQRIINENRKLITMLDDKIQQIVSRVRGE